MKINIKATNIELTEAINDYINKKIESLNKFLNQDNCNIYVEVGKTTKHHNKGEYFRAEFNIDKEGTNFYSSSEKEDLYASIDEARDKIFRDLTKRKDRRMTLYKRGATSVKKMFKGLTKRNPFTSKY